MFSTRTSKMRLIACVLLFTLFVSVVNSEEEAPSAFVTSINKNVEFPGNYEDVAGDFKKPGVFFHMFKNLGHPGFINGFVAAVSVIILSELGDKTFFIAAIMAMKHPRVTVFLGAMSALTVMTILSAFMGFATTVIPRAYTHYISTALFAIFGLKMLKEAYDMSPNEGQEEYEEVQKDILKRELDYVASPSDIESAVIRKNNSCRRKLMVFFSRIFLEAFTMTFLAEWGDRSQLTTIVLAAREDAFGVTLGAVIGHGICTSIAVIGGRMVAQIISVRSVTFIGAIVFLIFAVWALATGPGT